MLKHFVPACLLHNFKNGSTLRCSKYGHICSVQIGIKEEGPIQGFLINILRWKQISSKNLFYIIKTINYSNRSSFTHILIRKGTVRCGPPIQSSNHIYLAWNIFRTIKILWESYYLQRNVLKATTPKKSLIFKSKKY